MAWPVLSMHPTAFETDKSAASLPVNTVSAISNVDFYAGVPRALGSMAVVTVSSTTPYQIQSYSNVTYSYVGYMGPTGVYAWTPANTHVSLMPTTGLTGSTYWDSTNFGSWMVVTNDKVGELPHAINAATTNTGGKLAPLPGWPATWECTLIRKHRNVLWAANTIEAGVAYPNRVRWSTSSPSDALPASWTPSPGNDAGMNDLEVTTSEIVDFAAVGDVMFIGGAGGIWAARWVGGQYVYNFSQLNSQQGPRSLKCMESMGDAVAVLTLVDLLVLTESSEVSISIGRVQSIIRSMVAAELLYVPPRRQLIVAYNLAGETVANGYQHALIWDRDTNTFGRRDYTATPFTTLGAFTDMSNPGTGMAYGGANAAGIYLPSTTVFAWSMERDSLPAPDNMDLRARSIEADVSGTAGQTVTLAIGSQLMAGGAITWNADKTYTLGTDMIRADAPSQGKFLSYKISGNGNAKINGVRIYYQTRESRP